MRHSGEDGHLHLITPRVNCITDGLVEIAFVDDYGRRNFEVAAQFDGTFQVMKPRWCRLGHNDHQVIAGKCADDRASNARGAI